MNSTRPNTTPRRCKLANLALTVAVMLVAAGCETLTRSRFEMISVNASTRDDVRQTLGPPSHELGERWQFERPERHLNVLIDFNENGVVTRKQWIDANTGEWTDTKPPDPNGSTESTTIRTIK